MGLLHLRIILTSLLLLLTISASSRAELKIDVPRLVLVGDSLHVNITSDAALVELDIAATAVRLRPSDGAARYSTVMPEWQSLELEAREVGTASSASASVQATVHVIPPWVTLLPALMAIGLALWLRQVVVALLLGVMCGAWIVGGMTISGLWTALLTTLDVYILQALVPPDGDASHMSIIIFSLMIGGLVGLISRNGGTRGIVNWIAPRATSARHGQAATGLLGMAIFFDDYANTLVVGGAMRPVADRLGISRAKLAYLVDSTAAPISCLALITTWIGFQVGLLDEALNTAGLVHDGAYAFFLTMLPYSFYPILAIVFVFVISLLGRDFGPMLATERAARKRVAQHIPMPQGSQSVENMSAAAGTDAAAELEEDELRPADGKPQRALNAVIPIVVLIGGTLIGLFVTGGGDLARDIFGSGAAGETALSVREIIGNADSYKAIIWASLLAVLTAAVLGLTQRLMSVEDSVRAWFAGARSMLLAMLVLVLAWALAAVNSDLGTAAVITAGIGDWLPPFLLPALVFVMAAATAFATGSSWSVMSILIPIVVPLAGAMVGVDSVIFPMAAAAVLAGAVWGDHCSPVSDTTILSSMAAGCDHIEHVRTQMPYALLVGGVALFVCLIPVALGAPWWLMLPIAIALLIAVVRRFGHVPEM